MIGGAPAAAVVFARDVVKRVEGDERIVALRQQLEGADEASRVALTDRLAELREGVKAEMISTVAAEFDGIHDVHRAVEVGSIDEVVSVARLVARLRPRIIEILRSKRS